MVVAPLGPGQHRVVVGHHRDPSLLLGEEAAVHRSQAHDHAVGRRGGDQLFQGVAPPARRHHQRAVFHEAAGIEQVVDVLARGPLLRLTPPGDRLGPAGVQGHGMAVEDLLQVRADRVEVDHLGRLAGAAGNLGLLDESQRMAFVDRVADRHGDLADDARDLGGDHVLHLHGFHDHQRLARAHRVADPGRDADHRALERRAQGLGPLGTFRHGLFLGRLGLLPPEVEDGQGVDRVDQVAGPFWCGRPARGGVEVELRVRLGLAGQLAHLRLDEPRVHLAGGHGRMGQQVLQEGDVGGRALDAKLRERAVGLGDGAAEAARACVHDHLGQQAVEPRRGAIAGVAEAVDSHAGPGRRLIDRERPAGRPRRAVRRHGLQVHSRLHRMAARRGHPVLAERQVGQSVAGGDLQLQAHQVQARHLLGDRVLHLQTRVALDEDQVVAVDEEFHGAEAAVAGGLAERDRMAPQAFAHRRRQHVGRGDLNHLLALALQRAFAVVEVADVGPVAHHLDLDVARMGQEALDVELAVAERGLRLRRAALERRRQLVCARRRAHAAPAAAGHRFDHDGSVGSEEGLRRLQGRRTVGAFQDRHAAGLRQRPRPALVAEQLQALRRRPHEGQPGRGAGPRERRVLREEPVAGVHRVGAGVRRRRHDALDVQVGRRPLPIQRHRPVRRLHMQRGRVVLGKDCHALDAHLRGRPRDPHGDLAAIGDEQLLHFGPSPSCAGDLPRRTPPHQANGTGSAKCDF